MLNAYGKVVPQQVADRAGEKHKAAPEYRTVAAVLPPRHEHVKYVEVQEY
jgi:hypothetical protein